MPKRLKVFILEGSFEPPAFIKRLLVGLSKECDVFLVGQNDILKKQPIKGITYLSLGSSKSNWRFLVQCLQIQFLDFRLKSFIKWILRSLRMKKGQIQNKNLLRLIDHYQPDVIHLQWYAGIINYADLFKQVDSKILISQRGYHTNVRPFVKPSFFLALAKSLPVVDGFHSVSSAISENGDKIYDHPEKINRVVHTGLDCSLFRFRESYKRNTPLRILSIGRIHWKKGYELALRSLAILKRNGLSFTYEIIGGESSEEVRYLIQTLGLSNHIVLSGRISFDEVIDKMQSTDLSLLPSYEEGIANVAVEAMALGTPVISTDCGGMLELIDHGKTGWVVPMGDSAMMARQIQEFSALPIDEINNVRRQARNTVETDFNEEQMIEGMMALYREVLKH